MRSILKVSLLPWSTGGRSLLVSTSSFIEEFINALHAEMSEEGYRCFEQGGTTPEQRRALAQVFASQSQMQPAGMGRLLQDLTQTEYAQVSVVQQGDRFQVQVKGSPPAMPCQRRARNRLHPRTWRSLHSN